MQEKDFVHGYLSTYFFQIYVHRNEKYISLSVCTCVVFLDFFVLPQVCMIILHNKKREEIVRTESNTVRVKDWLTLTNRSLV